MFQNRKGKEQSDDSFLTTVIFVSVLSHDKYQSCKYEEKNSREIYKENEQAMTHRPEMDWVQASWYRTLNLYKKAFISNMQSYCSEISL